MARFNPNLGAISAGNVVLDAGEYDFSLGEPKVFHNKKEDSNTGKDISNWGIQVVLKVESEGKFHGQSIPQRFYLHTPEAGRMTKQFLMAAHGFNVNSQVSEAEFNARFSGEDYIDTDTNELGAAYVQCAGRRVRANVNQKNNPQREGEIQNTFRWFAY